MGVESVSGIWDLNTAFPAASDPRTSSDNHHRLIKKAIKQTFPNVSATIALTAAELNQLTGISGNVQAQLNSLSAIVSAAALSVNSAAVRVGTLSKSLSSMAVRVDELSSVIGATHQILFDSDFSIAYAPSGWNITKGATGFYLVNFASDLPDFVVHADAVSAGPYSIRVFTDLPFRIAISVQDKDSSLVDAGLMITIYETEHYNA